MKLITKLKIAAILTPIVIVSSAYAIDSLKKGFDSKKVETVSAYHQWQGLKTILNDYN